MKNVQNFHHPNTFETNEAIEKEKIVYGEYGTTDSWYKFDLKNNLMHRKMDSNAWESYEIVEHEIIDSTHNIIVRYSLSGKPVLLSFTLSPIDSTYDIIQCRYHWNNEIVGWFDREVKFKILKN